MTSLRRSILDQSNTSINSGIINPSSSHHHHKAEQQEDQKVVNFQESNYCGPSNTEGLARMKRKPFLRGSTMSMVARPDATTGFVTNNLGYYNNNYSDAMSVKSVQLAAAGGGTGNGSGTNNRHSNYNNVHIICRDDDRDPLLSSLMSSPSKRSLSTRSLLSTATTKTASKGFGTIDPQSLPQSTIFMQREESGLTKEEIAG